MKVSDGFWQSVRNAQDEARERSAYLSEARARPARRLRIVGRIPKRSWVMAAAGLAAACAVVWTLSSRTGGRGDLRFSVGPHGEAGQVGAWIAAPGGDPLPLQFSDGTLFSLSAGARVRVSSIDASGARLVLERGRALASVAHRPSSHWLVDVGPFEVAVVGTRFDVSWDSNDELFRLELHEGSVLVSGPCLHEPKRLAQGEALRVLCKAGQEEIVETRGRATATDAETPMARAAGISGLAFGGDSGPGALPATRSMVELPIIENGRRPNAPRPTSSGESVHSNTWQALAAGGRFAEALDLVERSGFEELCLRSSGADLLELGDAARFVGNPKRARQAYSAARGKLPGGGRSAYGLGLTAFDQEKDFAVAARWFELYLAEQPDGRLRREAEGRLIEAWHRAGDESKARRAAEQYLRDYPDGTQAPLARQLATP